MTALELLSRLHSRDIEVWTEGDKLCYSAPSGALTPDLRGELVKRKAEIIAFLRAANFSIPPIVPIPRDRDLPPSFAQQRLWFLDQLEPGSSAYNIPFALRLTGRLIVAALEQSLSEILRRHEVLRTTFPVVEGRSLQVIAPVFTLTLSVVDFRELGETEREAEVRRLATEEARRPFDLAHGPLMRASLLRLGEEEHIMLLTLHHIVFDGWSTAILFRELSVLYEAFSTGKPSRLPDLPIQYADFAVWQRQWLQGEVLRSQLSYWKKQLDNIPTLRMPTDRERPPVQSFRGAQQNLVLPKNLSEPLKARSHEEGVTLFMTLLAAFKTLLYHYTGQTDIVVGSPIAGRNRSEIEGLIGFFINTLVLRTDLSGDPSFRELLGRLRDVALGAYAHQDLPFEKLVEELQPERDLSRTPLFQIFFNMVNSENNRTLNLSGVRVEPFECHEPTSKFDLTLYTRDRNGSLWVSLVYNTDLFEPATINRLLGHYHTLLEAIAVNSQQRISSLPLLTRAERTQFSSRGNRVAPTNPFIEFKRDDIEQSIAARFERTVKAYPYKLAVKTKSCQWTYAELNRRANEIAATIMQSCGYAEERIALLFEHDAAMIAGILGVLKSGKTYVPLDPSYPKQRLAHILEDSQAKAILTNNANIALAKTQSNGRLQIINIDSVVGAVSTANPSLPTPPDALTYILYTSGSTGQPKGVMQNHRNVLQHTRNYTNNLHLNAEDRLTLVSSYCFDAAVMDIFGALLNGATLYPMDLKEEDRSALLLRMVEERITVYHSTPTVYRYLMGSLTEKEDLSAIRFVVLGGEEVQRKDIDLFQRYFPSESILVNGLGPTESTLALQYLVSRETQITGNTVPVGYPVEDVEVLLLNEGGREVEIYGEIGIRSAYVALGYWHKPEMTKNAFLSCPGGRRMYRTGDMGRLLPDGTIAFAGRKDFQIKIRGYRVELREIEGVLSEHAQVRETVVLARQDKTGDNRLVAYVVPHKDGSLTPGELVDCLKQKLPGYMIPPAFVFLDALPLMPNGKVNRKALPEPDQSRPDLNEYVAPQDQTERVMCEVWAKVLGVDRVGIDDDFFTIGGHSLLAAKLFARLDEEFGFSLPLSVLFAAPTIRELAKSYRASKLPGKGSVLVPLMSRGNRPPVYAVPGVFGNVVGYADLCLGLGSEQPFYGLQSVGVDGKEAPLDSIEEMAKLYIREIRSVQLHGPYALIGACFGGTVAYEMARQLLEAGHEVAFLGLLDPARREADEDSKSAVSVPRAFKRAKVLGSFLAARLQLYLAEIRGLDSGARIKFITSKIRTLSSKIQSKRGFRGVQREIHQLEVYRANVFALDHYHRKPLQGRLGSLEIFETARSRNTAMREPFDWTVFWKGPTTRHLLPGKDSGDMMRGKNARVLATLLGERLRAAFNQESTKKSKLPAPDESPTFLNLDRGYAD